MTGNFNRSRIRVTKKITARAAATIRDSNALKQVNENAGASDASAEVCVELK